MHRLLYDIIIDWQALSKYHDFCIGQCLTLYDIPTGMRLNSYHVNMVGDGPVVLLLPNYRHCIFGSTKQSRIILQLLPISNCRILMTNLCRPIKFNGAEVGVYKSWKM